MRAVLLALLPALAGCFTIASTVTVRPDGSGLVRDSIELQGFAALALAEAEGGIADKDRLRARALTLGEDVRLVGVEELPTGYVAVYAFPNVRDLAYHVPDVPLGDDDDETVADDALDLAFEFEPGAPATLRIAVPDEAAAPDSVLTEPTAEELAEAAQAARLLQAMLGDARLTVRVVVDGAVTETDAAFADGSSLTMLDLPLKALVGILEERPGLLESDGPPGGLAELLAGSEGVSIQPPGVVTVRFE